MQTKPEALIGMNPPFVIAELSCNHRQDLQIARDSIQAIKEAGADCVKLQTYTPDTMTIKSDREYFKIKHGSIWDGTTLYALYQEAYTPWEWHEELQQLSHNVGLKFFSSPFDKTAVDFLEKLNVPAFKIASFEITDIPLIEYAASKGKPIIISTGLAYLEDIDRAVQACRRMGNNEIILTKCTSAYPARFEQTNLHAMAALRETFGVPVGFSDHTPGASASVAAVALGAACIEKHFILDKKLGGPDERFSLDAAEFKSMVQQIRECHASLGHSRYELEPGAAQSRVLSRSLFVTRDMEKGDLFSSENVRSIRPGNGLAPRYLGEVLGRPASCAITRGTPLSWDCIVQTASGR